MPSYGPNFFTGGSASQDSYSDISQDGAKAFDGNTATYWLSAASAFPHWVKYDLGAGVTKKIAKLTMDVHDFIGATTMTVKDFTIQGSNDDSTYTTLQTLQATSGDGIQSFEFTPSATAYRYYEINITTNYRADSYAAINELYAYESTSVPATNIGNMFFAML